MSKGLAALLLVVLTALALAVAWHARDMAVDDAYITFRFAENLRLGHGLRWNPDGPPCEGYTNLTYVVGIAALGALGVQPVHAALGLAALAIAAIAWLLWRAVAGAGPFIGLALVPAVLVFATTDLTVHASRGLETLLFAALACAQLRAGAHLATGERVSRRHGIAAGVVATLLFLTRPDGVLMSTMVWLGVGWLVRGDRRRRNVLAWAIGTWLVAGAVYAVAKLAWFGYLLPNPFYAKAAVPGFAGLADTTAFVRDYWPLLLCGAIAALARPWWLRPVRAREGGGDAHAFLACLIVGPWLLYGSKIVHEIGFAHRFCWPLVPVIGLGAAATLAAIARSAANGVWRRAWPLGWVVLAAVVTLERAPLLTMWRQLHAPRQHDACTAAFLRLGRAIADTGIAPQLTLFCANAGATPFAAGAHHVDPAGLCDNGYCLRTPAAERGIYQASLKLDVVAWNLFPASPGAQSFDDDPRAVASPYLARYWRADDPDLDAGLRHAATTNDVAARKAGMFLHMWVLREHGTLVGEMDLGLPGRQFVYVWKASPHHDRLVAHLRTRVDVVAEAIDYASPSARGGG
jgi:arabinofuranosyltransferase